MDNINPTPQKKERRKIVLVDTEHLAESEARDFADMTTTAEKSTLKGFKGFFKKIWKHNIAREYYHQKEIVKARKSIYEKENVFANQEIDKNAHKEAMDAIVERFESEYEDMIDREAGESKDKLPEGHETDALKSGLQYLIRRYASGEISEGSFEEEKKRQLAFFREAFPKALPSAKMFADNIFEIAKESRQAVEHGMSIDELDLDFDIVLGKAKSALRTEANFTVVDKAIDKIKRVPILGHLFNETTVALVASSFLFTSKKILSSKVASLITFGGSAVVASSFAGMIENMRVKAERRQHLRERAKGMTFEAGAERREEMEKTQYDMVNAKATIDQLTSLLASIKSEGAGNESERALQDKVNEMLAELSDLEARIKIGNEKKIDLIAYSNITEVEKEKKDLLTIRAEAKVELRRLLALYPSLRTPTGQHFDAYLTSQIEAEIRGLKGGEAGIEAKDKLFRKMKRKKVGAMMGKTFIAGLLIGTAAQEIGAAVSSEQQGLVDSIIGKEDVVGHSAHMTPLGGAAQEVRDLFTGHHMHMSMDNAHTFDLNGAHMNLPEGVDMVANPDGTVDILRDGAPFAEDVPLSFDADGSLTQASIDALRGHGIDSSFANALVVEDTEIVSTPGEYLNNHLDDAQKVDRDMWFGNDTPAPIFDQNELKLWWGGESNTGIDANGNYVFTVENMTSTGSFQDGLSVDAQELIKNGGLKIAFSMSVDTQDYVFQVPVDIHGNATIDPDSEIGKIFFQNTNGHGDFLGKYAEVVQSTGMEGDTEHIRMLATHVDDGLKSVTDTVPTVVNTGVNSLGVPVDYDIYPPPFIPVVGRRPLEPMLYKPAGKPNLPADKENIPVYQYYYNGASLNEIQREFSEKHIPLDSYKLIERKGVAVWVDSAGNEVRRNPEREKERIAEYLKNQTLEYLRELSEFEKQVAPMHESCRVSVIIPARFEEKNLANLLDQYVRQVDEKGNPVDKNLFEINVIVNRKEGEKADRSLEIIEEWKKKNPGYNVNAVDVVFPKEKANVGTARKYITDLSLLRSINRAKSAGPLYIESEDADLFSVDKRTIAKLIKSFDEKAHVDVLRGIQDRQPEFMSKNDLFFFERRIWDIGEMVMRGKKYRPDVFKNASFVWNRIISGGWNTAYTAESYAQIGGYVPDVIGEDMKIGQKISVLRGFEDESGDFKVNTYTAETSGLRADSSPRRFLNALVKQEDVYGNFEDQSIKENDLDELLDQVKQYEKISKDHKDRYEGGLNTFFRFMKNEMSSSPEAVEIIKKTMFFLGLKGGSNPDYTINTNQEIVLTDKGMETIAKLLKSYKDENKSERGYRRQNSPLEKKKTYKIGDLDTPEEKAAKKSSKKEKVGKAERKETKTKETEGLSLNKDTDLIYSRMMSNPLDLNTEVASRVKRYKKPTFVIFEQDKTKRADFEKQIKVTQKKYPDAYIEYVKLPDDMSTISGVSANEYMKSVIENSSSEAKLDARVEKRLINPKITF